MSKALLTWIQLISWCVRHNKFYSQYLLLLVNKLNFTSNEITENLKTLNFQQRKVKCAKTSVFKLNKHTRREENRDDTNSFLKRFSTSMLSLLAHQVIRWVGLPLHATQDPLHKHQVLKNLTLTNPPSQALHKHQGSWHSSTLGASNKSSFSKAKCQGTLWATSFPFQSPPKCQGVL